MVIYFMIVFGLASLAFAVYSVATRRTRLKGWSDWITPDINPALYWIAVVSYALMGLFFSGFAGYILWLRAR